MKYFALAPAVAAMLSMPALAEPQTKTVTVDTPRFAGEKVVTRDREAGTLNKDASVTRKSDGAVATSTFERARTEDGWIMGGEQTDFQGRTRSFDAERRRVEGGFRTTGTATGRNGETYDYRAGRQKRENGFVAGRQVTNSAGETVYGKRTRVRNVDGKIVRRTQSVRDPNFRPPKRFKSVRPKAGQRKRR